ncbi:MAG: hypothetical protein KIT74_04500 [Fimbriimonadales bacterium]|nr:hypothetical protein [Fimbriimonadales bacterium]
MRRLLHVVLLASALLASGVASPSEPLDLANDFISRITWRELGPPTMGGRIVRLQIDETDRNTWYLGTASGGLWKTTNAGQTFEGLFQYEDVNSIGDIAVSLSHPNIVWLGSGEHNPRNSTIYGNGVYKSVDGGQTWTNMGLQETRFIGRIAIHHTNPDIVYVGAMGRTWGRNEDRGLYKTTDGGKTWQKILYVDDQTGVIEVQMHPKDPETLLVATWQRQRQIYDDGEPEISHGPGSAVYKTTDGGKTWRKLSGNGGLPDSPLGRTGIDYHRSDPNIVYLITGAARLQRDKNGVWKSTDGGETWTKVNDIAPRPMYYSQIRVDPNNPDIVFVLGVQLARSTDGGNTFTNLPLRGVHVDHHCLWINPDDSQHVLLGNDGGFYESKNGGTSFTAIKKMSLGQYYHVAVDNRRDYWVAGGLQDNGTYYGPSMARNHVGTTVGNFRSIGGGDGFVVRFDPRDHNLVYSESQNGNIRRTYLGPRDQAPQGAVRRPNPPEGQRQNWAWKTDFILCPTNPDVYYVAGSFLYRSENKGVDLKPISPRLPLTARGASTAIAVSPLNKDVIYVGTDDGALWVTRDGGENWRAIHDNVPISLKCYVSTLEASRYAEGRLYVAFDAHRSDDDAPYLFVTEDFGETWSNITSNLPEWGSTRCLREDTRNENVLYCGTEFFAYVSIDRGATWTRMNANLPTVAVHDFAISDAAKELVAGTHGRSIWALDISWLQQMSVNILRLPMFLFAPHSAVLWNIEENGPEVGMGEWTGTNPEFGATFYYVLGEAVPEAALAIQDLDGNTLASFAGTGHRGLNRAVWDLRTGGERVAPGAYRLVLSVGDKKDRAVFWVEPDPQSTG